MNKLKYIFVILMFIINCGNINDNNSISDSNNSDDFFSNKEIIFRELERSEIQNSEKYHIDNAEAYFSPPINSIKLSDKERDRIILHTGYGTNYFYTDSMFIDEKIKITCLTAYMKKDQSNLENFIKFIRNMKNGNNFSEEYYKINGKKNIQFKINMHNKTFLLYTIFEASNEYYLILNYTFPISYLEDSIIRIFDSLNSVIFLDKDK